jgi:hypothetical protein
LLAIALRDIRAYRFHERRNLRQRYLTMVVMNADFCAAAVAPQMDVGNARAGFQQQFQFLEPAKFISLAGNDDSKLKLAGLSACLGLPRPDNTLTVFVMMMIMVVMIMAVIAMVVVVMVMMMIVAMIAVFSVRVAVVVMSFAMRVAVIVTAFGAMLMLGLMIVIAFRPVNVLFFVM